MRSSTLAKTTAAVAAAAVTGGLASRSVESTWYRRLRKPSFQPPRQAFPIVWPLLYADVAAVSAGTIDQLNDNGEQRKAQTYTALLAVNLALNASWTWVFFARRNLAAAPVVAAALCVSSADLTRRTATVKGTGPAAVLGLYPLWCAFATVLSARIWQLNR
jgi:tryptophan-rich sensory protein